MSINGLAVIVMALLSFAGLYAGLYWLVDRLFYGPKGKR